MKGCGFHQSDAAHHLHWGCCGLGSAVQWLSVAPPRVSFESEAETCLEGQTLAPSERGSGEDRSNSCELDRY